MCAVGVLESESLESFPWQKLLAVVPKEPVVIAPAVVVMRGRLEVDPILPSFVRFP